MSEFFVVYGVSMLPIVELRGAIPLGVLVYGLDYRFVVLVAVAGNITVAFLLLITFSLIRERLEGIRMFSGLIKRLDARVERRKRLVERYGWLGLAGLVAIPLPFTGAWTGAIAANALRMEFPVAFVAICAGVAVAGGIVTAVTLSVAGVV